MSYANYNLGFRPLTTEFSLIVIAATGGVSSAVYSMSDLISRLANCSYSSYV